MKLNENQVALLRGLRAARRAASTPTESWWENLPLDRRHAAVTAAAEGANPLVALSVPNSGCWVRTRKTGDEATDALGGGLLALTGEFFGDVTDVLVPGALFPRDGFWRAPLWRPVDECRGLAWHAEAVFLRRPDDELHAFLRVPNPEGTCVPLFGYAAQAALRLALPAEAPEERRTDGAPESVWRFLREVVDRPLPTE